MVLIHSINPVEIARVELVTCVCKGYALGRNHKDDVVFQIILVPRIIDNLQILSTAQRK